MRSDYFGKKGGDGTINEYKQKVSHFHQINNQQEEEIEQEIMKLLIKGKPVLILMRNSIELMNDDVESLEGQKVQTDDLISMVIVGWKIGKGKKIWILDNNFNDNWS